MKRGNILKATLIICFFVFSASVFAITRFDLQYSTGSFIGEAAGDDLGRAISTVGDVNGDGFDDFIFGSFNNDEFGDGSGQTYLVFGSESMWDMDVNVSNVNASFIGLTGNENAGRAISGNYMLTKDLSFDKQTA
ncbi:integrin alpha, partial [Nanoarchaeota archaeon]